MDRPSCAQPAIEPGERFVLHGTVKLVRTRVEAAKVAVDCARLGEDLAQDAVGPFHLWGSEEIVLGVVQYERRPWDPQPQDLRIVEVERQTWNVNHPGVRVALV